MKLFRYQKGQSIFEVVLAIGIVTVVLIGIVALISLVQKNSTTAKNRAEGARMLMEAQEWLRNERDTDWANFYLQSGTQSWCLDNLGWSNSGQCAANEFVPSKPFLREVRFTRLTPNTEVKAEVSIKWLDSGGNHEIKSATVYTDWKTR